MIVSDLIKKYVSDCIPLINESEYGLGLTSLQNIEVFTFEILINPEKLDPIILNLFGVEAQPNHVSCNLHEFQRYGIGFSQRESRHTFSKGYGDCPAGCIPTCLEIIGNFKWRHIGKSMGSVGVKILDGIYWL